MDKKKEKVLACAINAIGLLAVAFGMFVLAWLFAVATPDQNSAECDALAEEMQGGGTVNEAAEHRASRPLADGRDREELQDGGAADGGRVHEARAVRGEAVRAQDREGGAEG